mgnify:CR=1 FL=1
MHSKKMSETIAAIVGALNIIVSCQDNSALRPKIRALVTALNSGETNLAELATAVLSAKAYPPRQHK